MDNESKSQAPPYVAYKTMMNFLERFKQGVPGRIDTTLMGSMAGGTRSQLMTSLKVFGLISETGTPTEAMKRLCGSEGPEHQKILADLVTNCYPYLFGDGFHFSTTTASLLREALTENTTATGETVNRCVAFLREAAEMLALQIAVSER